MSSSKVVFHYHVVADQGNREPAIYIYHDFVMLKLKIRPRLRWLKIPLRTRW